MGSNDETITIKLLAQDLASGKIGTFIGHLDKLAMKGGLVGSVAQGVGQSFGQMLNPVGLVTNAVGTLTDFLGNAVSAAMEEEAGIKRLTVAISENDRAWDGNIAAVEDVIESRQKLAFADDEQRDSLARLVSVTGNVTKALELQRTAMDLARLRGMNLVDAGELIGKVYGGNIGILSRYGIQLRKGVTATEALAEIQKRSAGQAEAFANTTAGAMQSLQIELDNVVEDIGTELLPIMRDLAVFARDDLVPVLKEVMGLFKDAGAVAQDEWVDGLSELGAALGMSREQLEELVTTVRATGQPFEYLLQHLEGIADQSGIVLPSRVKAMIDIIDSLPASAREGFINGLNPAMRRAIVEAGELSAAFDKMPTVTREAVAQTKVAIGSLKGAYTRAVRDAKDFDREWRFALANPDKGEKTAKQIETQMEKAMKRRNRALREGNREAFAVADAEVTRLQGRLDDLNQRDYQIDVRIAVAGGQRLNRMVGQIANIEGYKADGGPVQAGKAYVVGERQAEVFVPDRSGTILPSTRGLGGDIHLHVHAVVADAATLQAGIRQMEPEIRRMLIRNPL